MNNRIRYTACVAVFFAVGISFQAGACENLVAFGDNQIKAIKERVLAADEFDLEAVIEYDKLMCAERAIVRDLARRIGLASTNPSIRSHAILNAILEKENIVLDTVEQEGMSDEQRNFIAENPLLKYGVVFRDKKNACVSLYDNKKCKPSYAASVVGEEVTVRYDTVVAKLRLGEGGVLSGIWSETFVNRKISVPVKMNLN